MFHNWTSSNNIIPKIQKVSFQKSSRIIVQKIRNVYKSLASKLKAPNTHMPNKWGCHDDDYWVYQWDLCSCSYSIDPSILHIPISHYGYLEGVETCTSCNKTVAIIVDRYGNTSDSIVVTPKDDGDMSASAVVTSKDDGDTSASAVVTSKDDGDTSAPVVVTSKDDGDTSASAVVAPNDDGDTSASVVVAPNDDGDTSASVVVTTKYHGDTSASAAVSLKEDAPPASRKSRASFLK
jgi:hypothetical protein